MFVFQIRFRICTTLYGKKVCIYWCTQAYNKTFYTSINVSSWHYWKIIWFSLYPTEGTTVETTKTSGGEMTSPSENAPQWFKIFLVQGYYRQLTRTVFAKTHSLIPNNVKRCTADKIDNYFMKIRSGNLSISS